MDLEQGGGCVIPTVGSKHTENKCHTYCISVSKALDISAMRSKSVPNSGTDWIIFATNNQCHWHYFSAFNGTDFHRCRHWFWHWFSLATTLILSHTTIKRNGIMYSHSLQIHGIVVSEREILVHLTCTIPQQHCITVIDQYSHGPMWTFVVLYHCPSSLSYHIRCRMGKRICQGDVKTGSSPILSFEGSGGQGTV